VVPVTQRDRFRLLIDDAPGGLAGQLRIVRDLGERWRVQASGGLAGWACSLLSGWGACPGAGRWGRNRVRAVTKARIFDAMFSAVGSGADG
jgi:hypothetical protein